MNRDPILFRVDGTARLGWQHLTRSLTYAAALQRRRRPTYFLSRLDPGSLGLTIKRAGHDWLDADGTIGEPGDLDETIQEIRRLRPAAVVVDGPNVEEGYLAELSAQGSLVVSLDHLANVRLPSQLLINPLLAPGKEAYSYGHGAQLLLGARYALVRSELRRMRQVRSQEPPQPFRVLVALGDDLPGQSAELAKQLLNMPKVGRVDLVARPYHPSLLALQELAATLPDRLEVVSEMTEIALRLSRCHAAVTTGDQWSLEFACVGLPQLLIVQDEGHWPTAQRLEEEGAAVCVGTHENLSAGTFRQAVQNLLGDPLERQAMSRCGRQLIDGRGPDRLVTALEVMLHPSRELRLLEAA